MNKEILNEINRFREISGLRLLNEASIGGGWIDELLSLLGKSADEFDTYVRSDVDDFAKGFKKEIDDIASSLNKTSDDILSSIKAGNLPADEADEILKALLKTKGPVKDNIVSSYIMSKPKLLDIASKVENETIAIGIRNSTMDIATLKGKVADLRTKINNDLVDELPEIKQELLKRFDNYYNPILTEIESRGSSNVGAGTQKVTISSISDAFDDFAESIRPKTAAEQTDDVLGLIKSKRAAGKLEELTEEQIEYVENYIKRVLGDKPATISQVLEQTEKELKNLLNDVKYAEGKAKQDAIKTAKGLFNSFKICKEAKSIKACGASLLQTGGAIGITLAVIEFMTYGDTDFQEDIRFVKSKLPCLNDGDISITLTGGMLATDFSIDSLTGFGSQKEIKIKGKNSKGQEKWMNIFYDRTSQRFKDSTGNPISCPEGSGGDTSGFVIGGDTPNAQVTEKTEAEFKAAAMNGGFDVGKSFEKKSDTKYWGVDNDGSKSTTEWNGTTFIVKAEHI